METELMDETAQGRVKSPNYRSASQLYDAR